MNERIARGGGTLFKIIVALLGALLVMGIVLEFTEHTGFVFGVGGLTALLLGRWLFGRRPGAPFHTGRCCAPHRIFQAVCTALPDYLHP